jgi:hypothetical protein
MSGTKPPVTAGAGSSGAWHQGPQGRKGMSGTKARHQGTQGTAPRRKGMSGSKAPRHKGMSGTKATALRL